MKARKNISALALLLSLLREKTGIEKDEVCYDQLFEVYRNLSFRQQRIYLIFFYLISPFIYFFIDKYWDDTIESLFTHFFLYLIDIEPDFWNNFTFKNILIRLNQIIDKKIRTLNIGFSNVQLRTGFDLVKEKKETVVINIYNNALSRIFLRLTGFELKKDIWNNGFNQSYFEMLIKKMSIIENHICDF